MVRHSISVVVCLIYTFIHSSDLLRIGKIKQAMKVTGRKNRELRKGIIIVESLVELTRKSDTGIFTIRITCQLTGRDVVLDECSTKNQERCNL